MITQPTNVTPSTLGGIGNGVIDVVDGLTVSWQFGGSAMLAYKITVYQNDSVSTEKYTTNKVTLDAPFNPYDYKGNINTFTATKITASELSTAGIINGYANGYKLIIRMYYGVGENDYIEQSSASAFITRDKPSLAIYLDDDSNPPTQIPNPYRYREIALKGVYSQAQGDGIAWVRWRLLDYSDNETMIEDTNSIETSVLKYSYDGLMNRTVYKVMLTVQTTSGVEVSTDWNSINVSYTIVPSNGVVKLCKPMNKPYIQIEWSNKTEIEAVKVGDVEVDNGLAKMDDNSYLTWQYITTDVAFSFKNPWTIAWRGTIQDLTTSATKVELHTTNGSYYIKTGNGTVDITDGNTTIKSWSLTLKGNDTFVVVLSKDHVYIKQITYTGGLLPSESLYPSENLYPQNITKVINKYDSGVTYTQRSIDKIVVYGQQDCEYAYLYSGDIPTTELNNILGDYWYEPTYNGNTYFITDFYDGSTDAFITGGNNDNLDGVSIYRKNGEENVLHHVLDISSDYLLFRDFGVKSNTTYRYYIYIKGNETYSSIPYESDDIKPVFGTYTLIECTKDNRGVYHVVNFYIVAGNVNAGSLSNNNKPEVLENFTQYPTWTTSNQNYKSGTLTALIGTIDDYNYSDSWELADSIMSLPSRTTHKFLRDSKGGMWKIETNGAISMSVNDSSYAQPIKMSLPWVEVDSCDDASIVLAPYDTMWEKDQIYETKIDLDVVTGRLTWRVPNNYLGSTLIIRNNSNLIQTGNGYIEPAQMNINSEGRLIASV